MDRHIQITVQLPKYVYDYPKFLQTKITVIPNRVEQVSEDVLSRRTTHSRKVLLSVGRLSFQKNFKLLIDCFENLSRDFPEWDLIIAGDGEEFTMLEELVNNYQLNSRVKLLGAVEDVQSLYLNADLFCLPSLWEGFPNSLAEALSFGLPSVGFRESSGVNELIIDNYNGLLALGNNNQNSLTNSLSNIMNDSMLRDEMSKKAIDSMKQFEPMKIFDRWEDLFIKISN